MKNYRNALILATALGMASASMVQAGTLTVANKISDQTVKLAIRGERSEQHSIKVLEAEKTQSFLIKEENVKGKPTFEVIAFTGDGTDPGWQVMGGKCAGLVTVADHTIIIDSTLGKISCTNDTAQNPVR